jgi:hypothetical protein
VTSRSASPACGSSGSSLILPGSGISRHPESRRLPDRVELALRQAYRSGSHVGPRQGRASRRHETAILADAFVSGRRDMRSCGVPELGHVLDLGFYAACSYS